MKHSLGLSLALRRAPGVLVVPALATLAACGQLSNDDLVFLRAVPSAEEVRLDLEADGGNATALVHSVQQPLVGQRAEFFDDAVGIAAGLNEGVAAILSFVDTLGDGFPPTRRGAHERVWGPVTNVDGSGRALRLRIAETLGVDGAPRFEFCLHIGPDGSETDDVSCEEDAGEFRRVLFGDYLPRAAEEGLRSGSGRVVLDFEPGHDANPAQAERGVFSLVYDFAAGGQSKDVHITWERPPSPGEADKVRYDYSRDAAGHVEFFFQLRANAVDDTGALELVTVDASWDTAGLGRGDASVMGGDLPFLAVASATECWDAAQARTYFALRFNWAPANNVEEGSLAACPAE